MTEYTKQDRVPLRRYFRNNAIPTEEQFGELIESQLNQVADGIFKDNDQPISLVAAPGDQRRVLRLFSQYPATEADWILSLKPDSAEGLGVSDRQGKLRLVVDQATGNVGIGGPAVDDRLTVQEGNLRLRSGSLIASNQSNQQTAALHGQNGRLSLRPVAKPASIELRGDSGVALIGGAQSAGNLQVRNSANRATFNVDGATGHVVVGRGASTTPGRPRVVRRSGVAIDLREASQGIDRTPLAPTVSRPTGSLPTVSLPAPGRLDVIGAGGQATIGLDGKKASAYVGGRGRAGTLLVRDANNRDRITLEGTSGHVRCGGVVLQGATAEHINEDGALYRMGENCYLTVPNLMVRGSGSTGDPPFQFNTGAGNLTMRGSLQVGGPIHANNSDIYFDKTDHDHAGFGNQQGWAAIENAKDYEALMILGRTGADDKRQVRLWDRLQVHGRLEVDGTASLGWCATQPDFGAPLTCGFYEAASPKDGVPDASHAWAHLIAVRHRNKNNHHQLQIASRYTENNKLYFRKFARDLDSTAPPPAWNELATMDRVPTIRAGTAALTGFIAGESHPGAPEQRTTTVNFGHTFRAPPRVIVALTHIDVDKRWNTRLALATPSITATKCAIRFSTWADTQVWAATASWIAIGY